MKTTISELRRVIKQLIKEEIASNKSLFGSPTQPKPLTPYKPSMMDRFKLGVKKVFGTENEKHRELFNKLLLQLANPDTGAWNVVKVGNDATADTVMGKLFVSCNPQSPQLSLSRQGKEIELELENKAEACQEVYDALQ